MKNPSFFPVNTYFCSTGGNVNTTLLETIYQQTKDISTIYPTWPCLSKWNGLIAHMQFLCQRVEDTSQINVSNRSSSVLDSPELVFEMNECKFSKMVSAFDVTFRVNTATDIAISNEVFLPRDMQHYQIEFNVTSSKLVHITFRNNTFKNLHIHLDNSIISANIEENIFTGSGIKIFKESENGAKVILIKNNKFQREYKKSAVEFWNTENVFLKNNYFKNFKIIESFLNDDKQSIGIICHISKIKMSDSLFEHVKLEMVMLLENCSVEMDNISFKNTSSRIGSVHTEIKMEGTRGFFSNMMFVNNTGRSCIHVQNGELQLMNTTFYGNEMYWGYTIEGESSNIQFTNVTAVKNKGVMMSITNSVLNMSSCTLLENSITARLITSILNSHVEIDGCLLEGNFDDVAGLFALSTGSFVNVSRSNFTLNKALLISFIPLPQIPPPPEEFPLAQEFTLSPDQNVGPVEPLLEPSVVISSCRFEENIFYKGLIDINSALIIFYNCYFLNNLMKSTPEQTPIGMIDARNAAISLDNCTIKNTYGANNIGPMKLFTTHANITNCIFTNNSGSTDAGVIDISQDSTLFIEYTLFEQNKCGVDGGAIVVHGNSNAVLKSSIFIENKSVGSNGGVIFLEDNSRMVSENCTFNGNTAALDGGAIAIVDHSSYNDSGSLFFDNIATYYGKLNQVYTFLQ